MNSPKHHPPQNAERFLEWFVRDDLAEEVLGDLEEKFYVQLEKKSPFQAKLNYWFQVLNYLRPFAIRKSTSTYINHPIMLQHYFKIGWRNLLRNKGYSVMNISGLATGMACSILIFLWVQNELSYDRFHAGSENIYRLNAIAGSGEFKAAISPAGMVAGLKNEMPEIQSVVRLGRFDLRTALFEADDQQFVENDIFYADTNFLSFFNFPLIKGDKETALSNPNGILLTETTAKKYFGDEEPLGKTIRKDNNELCTVTGILADVPPNSHLQYSMILPMAILAKTHHDLINDTWGNFGFYSYIRFYPQTVSSASVLNELREKVDKIYQAHSSDEIVFQLQPLTDIHLHSGQQFDVAGHGNVQYVNIFFLVAIFILIVACINFMNLATARSARRAKEVGLRKVVGAKRFQLIAQFLSESMIISFLSLFLAVGIVYLLLPAFNNLAGKVLSLQLEDTRLWAGFFAIALLTGLFSGSYPALFLSGFKPVKVLKGTLSRSGGNKLFRNGLVITQFVVSLLLLVGTTVVYKQLSFIQNKNLGFDKSNLLYFSISGDLKEKRSALETALSKNPLTRKFSMVSDIPTYLNSGGLDLEWEGRDPNLNVVIPNLFVDEHFIDVFELNLLNGRGFSKEHSTDNVNFVVNETAVELMDMTVDNAVGKNIKFQGRDGIIIGVVQDFNFKPLQYAIEPLILQSNISENGYGYSYAVVRTPANGTESAISALEEMHESLNPTFPLTYHFLDQDLDNLYKGEKKMGAIFNLFAMLAIFISCLGLYGLSAFMAEQRNKELGIRKVLGASTLRLVNSLSKDFFLLVLIALVIAIPISWYMMNEWLQDFAYRTEISWWVFAAAGIGILAITALTVSYQVIKAATMNPVESLRSE